MRISHKFDQCLCQIRGWEVQEGNDQGLGHDNLPYDCKPNVTQIIKKLRELKLVAPAVI